MESQLLKIARANRDERNREARARYRSGGAQLRRKQKIQQRVRRRKGGGTLKMKVRMQQQKLKYRPIRIRKEPRVKRPRDKF